MSNKEISVSKSDLEECDGNLKSLLQLWSSVSVNQSPAKNSSGHSAELINDNCLGAKQTKNSMDKVLSNSIQFFKNIGITFVEVDEKSANSLKGE